MLTLVLIASLVATTVMTLFSYIVAHLKKTNFKEPELLNELWNNSQLPIYPSKESVVGWVCHYMMGIFFGLIFFVIFTYTSLDFSILNYILFGIAAGIMGILGWQFLFWINPNPPDIQINHFFIHLIIAHMIFGVVIGLICTI